MLYALIDGTRRGPLAKGERAVCACGSQLIAVLPDQNVKHWRHPAGDCDSWSENEGPWHIGWKERFDLSCREVELIQGDQRHRADILVKPENGRATVIELQHSPIGDEERLEREVFYKRDHKMFWIIHIHNESAFHGISFGQSYLIRNEVFGGKTFAVVKWAGRGSQFIDKWKRSTAHVILDSDVPPLFYLATNAACRELVQRLGKGEFAIRPLDTSEFVRAVLAGPPPPPPPPAPPQRPHPFLAPRRSRRF